MATKGPEAGPRARAGLIASVLALSAVAAVAFGRVFQGRATSGRLALAAAISVLIGAALERRSIAVALLASAAGLAVATGLIVFPETTRLWLPTLRTWHAATAALGAVGRTAAAEVAPAAPLPPLLLASLVAVWTSAFASQTLAARARSPFLSLLPPAALLAFANLIVADGARAPYVIGFLLAALAVLFSDGLRRVADWGPVVSWRGKRRFRSGVGSWLRGARRVAAVTLGIALFAPWILPGFGAAGLVDVRANGDAGHVSLDPLVDIRPQLIRNPATTVFTVRSDEPSYWRTLALDRFTGEAWRTAGDGVAAGRAAGGALDLQRLEDVDPAAARVVHQHFTFDHLSEPWLPAAFDPIVFGGNHDPIEFDPASGLLLAPNGTYRGFSYDVTSVAVSPTPAALEAAGNFAEPPNSSPETSLPASVPRQIVRIAHQLTDDQPTTYQKILAIQDHLLTFRYSEQVKSNDSANQILYFLTKSRTGYCQQFAGTMAVLLRALGIPARVAIGFTPGRRDPRTGVYRVTTQNAHAWVEALFPRYGWLAFESTPGRANPVAARYTQVQPSAVITGGGPTCVIAPKGIDACTPASGGTSTSRPTPRTGPAGTEGHTPAPVSGGARHHGRATTAAGHASHPWVAWLIAAVLLAAVAAVPAWKLTARRRLLSRAASPADRALGAYLRMTGAAADVGMGRRPSETIFEYRTRLASRVGTTDGDLERLARVAAAAAYSGADVTAGEADDAVHVARRVTEQLRRSAGPARRVAGWFRIERSRG